MWSCMGTDYRVLFLSCFEIGDYVIINELMASLRALILSPAYGH